MDEHKQIVLNEIEQANAVVSLQEHPGFKVLVDHIEKVIEGIREYILNKDFEFPDEFYKLQERYKAYSFLRQAVSNYAELLAFQRQELERINADESAE